MRLRLLVEDYRNSYYGRLAAQWLRSHGLAVPGGPEAAARFVAPGPLAADSPAVPTAGLIRWLIAAEMNDEALDEVQYAERAYGSSPVLLATRAWLVNRKGDLRPAITLMRQAYPQFLAAGGETLPADILRIMFPRDYWPLITKYSALNRLDPYLVTALMAQESTFDARVVSGANAIGLMQVVPSTGRLYARKLGLRGYSTKKLTVPDTNVRIGTAYFADLVRQFGGEYFALAGYNAGDSRAVRWKAERPGLDRDEFIDDIPFPETQNYLRRVIGTAEDYRALYGTSDARSPSPATTVAGDKAPASPDRPAQPDVALLGDQRRQPVCFNSTANAVARSPHAMWTNTCVTPTRRSHARDRSPGNLEARRRHPRRAGPL